MTPTQSTMRPKTASTVVTVMQTQRGVYLADLVGLAWCDHECKVCDWLVLALCWHSE